MSVLKQRVPISKDRDGKDLFITLEWLKDLNATILSTVTTTINTTTTTDPRVTPLIAQVTALTMVVNTLSVSLTALTTRVVNLERGYQS